VHPGVKSLWEFHEASDPARVAQEHDGCGAAIRVSPVGILYRSARLEDLVRAAREASIPTHGGSVAIAAAAATAAGVSAAIDGASPSEILKLALGAADLAERLCGNPVGTFAESVRRIHEGLRDAPELRPADIAARFFPDTPLTIAPLALALATVMESATAAILLAANIGGDSDSVASMAGGILGARNPATVKDEWYSVVERVNGHDLVSLGNQLAQLRD
jgi:ADP-ribosylglycohydrolase